MRECSDEMDICDFKDVSGPGLESTWERKYDMETNNEVNSTKGSTITTFCQIVL